MSVISVKICNGRRSRGSRKVKELYGIGHYEAPDHLRDPVSSAESLRR